MLATRQISSLPTPFERKLFSIVKYGASDCSLSLARLKSNAECLIAEEGDVRVICAEMIIDAWHMIESARKVHKALWAYREKFSSGSIASFIDRYACLKILRDYIQHIDNEVDGDPISHAFMGTLTFCQQIEPKVIRVHLVMATALRSGGSQEPAPIHSEFDAAESVSQFTLYVGGTKVRLDALDIDCSAIAEAVMDSFDRVASARPEAVLNSEDAARDDLYVILKGQAV